MTHGREPDGVQLVVFGDLILIRCSSVRGRSGGSVTSDLARIHELAIELAVRISRDATARRLRRAPS